MKTTMEQLKQMVDVNTIIGNPVMAGSNTVIVPVSRVALGFLSGGGEYGKVDVVRMSSQETSGEDIRHPFAGTSVSGLNLSPTAFLVINDGCVKVLPAHYNCTLDRIIEMLPQSIQEVERLVKNCCKAKAETSDCCTHEDSPQEEPNFDYQEPVAGME